jgi:hypothetical protein
MKHTLGIEGFARNNDRSAKRSQTVGPLARKTRGGRNFPGLQPGLGKSKAVGPKTNASRSDANIVAPSTKNQAPRTKNQEPRTKN